MRVLHVIGSFLPSGGFGGLQEATLQLCRGLREHDVDVTIMTTNARGDDDADLPLDQDIDVSGLCVRYHRRFPRARYMPSVGLVRSLRREVDRYDLVHATGLFTFPSLAAARIARSEGVRYVITPSGMGRPWALSHRSWKKRPYWWAVEARNLREAAALHATSDMEADDLSVMFPSTRVFVVPNAVAAPTSRAVQRKPGRVLFLGRLHPIKGLDLLVDAMHLVTRRLPHAELVLAGPDETGLWPELVRRMSTLSPRPRATYLGAVTGSAKSGLLASGSVLALTSHSESFGMVVAEALAHGTPVVTSHGCPWQRLEGAGAGHWVEGHPETVADAIVDVLTQPDGGSAMQRASRALATVFTSSVVGEQMARQYGEILRRPRAR